MALRRVLGCLVVALGLWCAHAEVARADLPVAVAQPGFPQDRSDLPVDGNARFGILPNGMRYVIYRNTAKARATAIRFQIVAGSMQESDSQRGLAHFVEHMAFNGSTNIAEGDLQKILAREGFQFGSDVNAFTDYEKTDYVLNLPSNQDEPINTALFILREIAGNLTFAPEAIERERGVILSEERMRASPQTRSQQAFIAAAHPGELYAARNPIGLIDTIKTAPRQALVDYYDDFYRPEFAMLVVVGDFDADAMQSRIEKTFGDWKPARPGPLRIADYGKSTLHGLTAATDADPGTIDTESVTWLRPFITTPDNAKARVGGMAKYMATQIMNDRFRRLAEDTATPYLSATLTYDNQHLDANTTTLSVIPKPGQQRAAFTAALKSLFQFRDLGARPDEVSDFIAESDAQTANLLRAAKTRFSDDIADEIMTDLDEDGVFQSADQYADLWTAMKPALTPALIDDETKLILTGEGPVLFRQASDTADFDADAMKAAFADAAGGTAEAWTAAGAVPWPYTDFGPEQKPVQTVHVDTLDYRHYVFANGVTANIKSSPLVRNQIIVSVRFGGGYRLFSPSENISLQQARLYDPTDGGLGRISPSDMARALADKTISVQYDLDEGGATLSGYTTSDSYATQLQVLMAYATDAAYRPDAYANFQSSLGYLYSSMNATPDTVMAMNEGAYLTNGDARFRFPLQSAMAAMSNDTLAGLYRRTLDHVPVEVDVTGDISYDAALKDIEKTFATLPQVPDEVMPAPGADTLSLPADHTPQVFYHQGRDDQEVAVAVFPTTDALSDIPTTRGLSLLAAVLDNRLDEDFREQQGATYDIDVQAYGSETFKGYGYLSARCTLKPDMDQAFADAVLKAAKDIADKGISADELNRARMPLLDGLNDDAKNNEDWQTTIAGLYGHPERWTYEVGVARQYMDVTVDDIQRLAKAYLRPDTMLRLKSVPAPKS